MDLIIRGGTVVTATDTFQADLGIQNGVIAQIGQALESGGARRVIDADGLYIFPGGVDTHTHLDTTNQGTRTADDFRTGTIAAATLDVTNPEPLPEGHPFYTPPAIRLTPHVCGGTEDGESGVKQERAGAEGEAGHLRCVKPS